MSAVVQPRSADAGINDVAPEILLSSDQKERERLRSNHYVYFPLGAPPISPDVPIGSEHYGDLWIGDRRSIHKEWIRRGVIEGLFTFSYMERNQTNEALDKENDRDVEEFEPHEMLAGHQASELYQAYNDRADARGMHILDCITGAPAEVVARLAKIIMPAVPTTIVKIVKELNNESRQRIAAIQDPRAKALGERLLGQMLRAATEGHRYAVNYIQRTEAEQVSRATPGGHGKLTLDMADLYYYQQIEKEPANATGSLLEVSRAEGLAAESKEPESKPCPRCFEAIKFKATYCRWCQLDLSEPKKVK